MSFTAPTLDCDIVMKGGITSGVVYPKAVTQLAEEYRFHNVGGTSAGAIAAALTGAAELGRHRHPDGEGAGFERLDGLSAFLATDGNLIGLFQPQAKTKSLFRLFMVSLQRGLAGVFAALPRAATSSLRGWLLCVVGTLPGVALGILFTLGRPDRRILVWSVTGLLMAILVLLLSWTLIVGIRRMSALIGGAGVLALLGMVTGTVLSDDQSAVWIMALAWLIVLVGLWFAASVAVGWNFLHALSANRYGMCSGGVDDGISLSEPLPGKAREIPGPRMPLGCWLSEELDLTADVVGAGRLVWASDLPLIGADELNVDFDQALSLEEGRALGIVSNGYGNDEGPLRVQHLRPELVTTALPRRPLVFGDLESAGVSLRMLTTNLTHGRPYRLPMETYVNFNSKGFFFDPEVWRDYFPAHVVQWMIDNPPQRRPGSRDSDWEDWELLLALMGDLRPLPDPEKLPVVVATRMSLSFPILISAVPLWAVDWSLKDNIAARFEWRRWRRDNTEDWRVRVVGEIDEVRDTTDQRARFHPTLCWFSDGGISSNFPIHFFDQPLPRWPTFGLNLREPHPDHPIDESPVDGDESVNVWLPEGSVSGHHLRWTEIPSLVKFGRVIADTLQNWTDNAQLRVHGYWDRVAHINMGRDDGGMNLNMDPGLIDRLGRRGQAAAVKLADRFRIQGSGPKQALGWDRHRWLRYRSSMQLIEELLEKVNLGYGGPSPARSYEELVSRISTSPPRSYQFSAAQREFAEEQTRAVVDLATAWNAVDESFGDGAPAPSPELRIAPPI